MLFSLCLRGQLKRFLMFAPMMSHLIVSVGTWTAAAVPWDGILTICVSLVVDRMSCPENSLTETFVMLYHSPTVRLRSHQTVKTHAACGICYSIFSFWKILSVHTTPFPLPTSWIIFALMLTCAILQKTKQMHMAQWLDTWLGYFKKKKKH